VCCSCCFHCVYAPRLLCDAVVAVALTWITDNADKFDSNINFKGVRINGKDAEVRKRNRVHVARTSVFKIQVNEEVRYGELGYLTRLPINNTSVLLARVQLFRCVTVDPKSKIACVDEAKGHDACVFLPVFHLVSPVICAESPHRSLRHVRWLLPVLD
jgi:hypothetical protein